MPETSEGPATNPRQLSTVEKLERYSSQSVEQMLRHLVANGEIADYDDEIANRLKDAADLCAAVREILPLTFPKPQSGETDPVKTLGERVDAAAERAIDAIGHWITARGAALSAEDKDAIKAQAIIALRTVIFEAIKD